MHQRATILNSRNIGLDVSDRALLDHEEAMACDGYLVDK